MSIIILALAAVAGIVPMLTFITFIYWLDRYEREPWWLVALVFLWGAIGGAGFGCFCNSVTIGQVDALLGAEAASWIGPVIVAPLVEEVTKIIPLFALVLMRQFDNATDGLIYGAATGLGFAMTENISYFYSVGTASGLGAMIVNIIVRTCFTALVHCAASASWGFCLGLVRYRHPALRWLVIPPVGYACAITIHAFWNGSATYTERTGSLELQAAACGVILVLAFGMFVLTQLSLFLEHRMIKTQLEAEATQGTIPAAHAAIIPYWLKRRQVGWLDMRIDKEAYVKAATLLAFRNHQAAHATGPVADKLRAEADTYRQQVRLLLARAAPSAAPPPGPQAWGA